MLMLVLRDIYTPGTPSSGTVGQYRGQTGLFDNIIKLQFVKSEGWGMENWLLKGFFSK